MSRLRNRSRQCRGRGQERTKPLCASTWSTLTSPPSSRAFGREFLKRYRPENMMTPYEETDSLPRASNFLKPGQCFQALDALVAATSDNDAPRRMYQAKARAAGSREETSAAESDERCGGASPALPVALCHRGTSPEESAWRQINRLARASFPAAREGPPHPLLCPVQGRARRARYPL
jgi:hypothetical protein